MVLPCAVQARASGRPAVADATVPMSVPDWATHRCDWCGEFMPFGSMYHTVNGERVHTHGLYADHCDNAAQRATDTLAVEYTLLRQAVHEATERIGRFMCETDDDEWCDPKALQGVLLTVDETLTRGQQGTRHYAKDDV